MKILITGSNGFLGRLICTELENENESFQKPTWLGKEVTNDNRYYNVYLTQRPFKTW